MILKITYRQLQNSTEYFLFDIKNSIILFFSRSIVKYNDALSFTRENKFEKIGFFTWARQ